MGRGRRASSDTDRAVDAAVGQRVRGYREGRGLSQTDLANEIGVTFQQVQKYERGINRIAASRLTSIAAALRVPVVALIEDDLTAPMLEPARLPIIGAYERCSPRARRIILKLAQSLAEEGSIDPDDEA